MSPREADVIIIGAGTAGLVLASRLSEDPSLQVIVLEAGQDQNDDPRVKIPALWPGLVGSEADWNFVTQPQAALNGKVIPLPQGRLIGGSSAMNGQAFIANSKANVDAWGKLDNPGWDWDTLNSYYRKVFTLTLPEEKKQKELGLEYVDKSIMNTGPVQVSFPDSVKDPIANAWVKSFKSLGYAMRHDPFCGKAVGGYTNATTIDPVTKTRSYAGSAYYKPAARRSNLQLITGALVEKLLFKGSTSDGDVIATGVQFAKDGESQTIKARKEVILSAGAFNSPKILELSGIGSRTLLDEHRIPVVVDNPNVGENLQDHVLAGISFEVQDFINTKDDLMRRVPEVVDAATNDYKTHQFGPFTVGGNYSSALLPVPDFSRPETGASELSAVLDAVPSSVDPTKPFQAELAGFVRSLLTNPEEATGGYFTYPAQSDFRGSGAGESIIRTKFPENYITIAISLLHPLSCGSSHIASADPKVSPAIDPRYLSNPADVEVLARHVRYIDVIAKSEPLASMLKPGGKRSPGIPDDLRDVPLDKVKDFVKSAAKSTFHPTSTCAMMPREKGGVVDSRLRVWGTKGLRVVDASVIPIITRGNPQSSVYAIAERAADLLKLDLVA
ncbi:glucose-methanol-choline (gmc) oxidoreductase [Metarhizium guizhouense ARSEF 977]|uniref:Glucose-methanol-choline (Gmc) oxidoreductase n=1 Tax=Metarhizium guizhouense (strain ARSEF 977) TaxID=1276136 RepID=A0A0B4GFG5_METGA|nr:glucose-methanol-choline (gmc) oxidoreductase [Metarhizium guizhouense ARSEF 977]